MKKAHPLHAYLKSTGQTAYAFAATCGIAGPHLSTIMSWKKLPSLITAWNIEQATKRRVKMQDLCPEEWK